MAKRKSRSRRRHSVRRASGRRRSFATRRSGFIDKEMLVAAGATAAGFVLPNMLLDKLTGMSASLAPLASGYPRIAAKAGMGLAVAFYGKRFNPRLAMAFGIGCIASAAVDAYNAYQVQKTLSAVSVSLANPAVQSLPSGTAGYDEALPVGNGGVGGYENAGMRMYAGG